MLLYATSSMVSSNTDFFYRTIFNCRAQQRPSLFSPNLNAQTTLKASRELPKQVRPFSREIRIHLALSSRGRWTC